MPVTLFMYILRDLCKVLLISTVVLVAVVAFGAAIRPLAAGTLGPLDLAKYIVLAMPPMLQFALPFSAALSATLVYHRMTSDNEIAACAFNGVPYTHLLLPAASLGVVLTILLSFLSNFVSPRFWEAMARTAHLDAPKILEQSIRRGEPIRVDNALIYARDVALLGPPEGSEAYESMWLGGLVIVFLEQGQPMTEITARQGVLKLFRTSGSTIITSVLEGVVAVDSQQGRLWRTDVEPPTLEIPDTFKDKTKFMDLGRLREMARNPGQFWRVEGKINDLRRWLTGQHLYREIDRQLRRDGIAHLPERATYQRAGTMADRYELHAASLGQQTRDGWLVVPGPDLDQCRVIQFRGGQPVWEWRADAVRISPAINLLEEPSIRITLHDADGRDLTTSPPLPTSKPRVPIGGLRVAMPIADRVRQMSAEALAEEAGQFADNEVTRPLKLAINKEIKRLYNVILSRLHERAALSVSCLVMMLLGACLAIGLRSALPLTVYFWSFVPAVLGLIVTGAGVDLVQSLDVDNAVGLAVLWAGNLGVLGMAVIVLWRVRRN